MNDLFVDDERYENVPPSNWWNTLFIVTKMIITGRKLCDKTFSHYHLIRRKYILSQTSKHFKKDKFEPAPLLDKRLLDVGCGKAPLGEWLTLRGAEVTAIDPSEIVIERAKKSAEYYGAEVSFRQNNLEDLVIEGRKYDVVLCMDVFEYSTNPDKMIWALSQILNSNGIIIFSTPTPNIKSFMWHKVVAEWMLGWTPKGFYPFCKFISPEKLVHMFERNKFKVLDIKGLELDIANKCWRKVDSPDIRYMGAAVFKEKPKGLGF